MLRTNAFIGDGLQEHQGRLVKLNGHGVIGLEVHGVDIVMVGDEVLHDVQQQLILILADLKDAHNGLFKEHTGVNRQPLGLVPGPPKAAPKLSWMRPKATSITVDGEVTC